MSKVKQWVIYFDASALVKRYSEETGSSTVDEVFRYLPLIQILQRMFGKVARVSTHH